jgi:hypothetical protein
MLASCIGMDMSLPANIATLLYNIVYHFKIFDIVLYPLNHGIIPTDPAGNIYEQVTVSYNTLTGLVVLKINNST